MFGRGKKKQAVDEASTEAVYSGEPSTYRRDVEARDWIEHNALTWPSDKAMVDLASGREFTHQEMNERVGRLAAHLRSLGVGRGDRVGFLAMNSTDIMEMIFATWRLGAISLALNFRLTAKELAFIVGDAGPKVVIADAVFSEVTAELKDQTEVVHWITTDGVGGDTEYEQAIASATLPILQKDVEQPISDQCLLMYSSGTTGLPKGVIITHEMMLYSAIGYVSSCDVGKATVNLVVLPLFHIGGLNVFACPTLYFGGKIVVQRTFEPGETLTAIGNTELGITHLIAVPAVFNALKMHPDNPITDFSRMEVVLAGAEAVPDALVQWWFERGVKVREGYGMTESVASNCVLPKEDVPGKIGSAGKAALHTEMKIVREDGTDADPDELGELWMRGPSITPGYWKRPEANEKSFVGGWFRSGDIARRDAEGYFYIEDRVKDMYISGGENVYPAEVENTLYEMEQIAEVAVIGVEDSRWGEVGCAVVALKEGTSLTIDDLLAHCQGKLATFKQPAHLAVVEALPRNATGKVLKFQLRESIPPTLELR